MREGFKIGLLNAGLLDEDIEEIRLDFTFEPGKRLPNPNEPKCTIFKLVPSKTSNETATIQQIIAIIIDPNGKGLADHWEKTASSYFQDAEMSRRSKIPPPEKSDYLLEIVF